MNKIKVIALFGKSGAGKDTIQKLLLNELQNVNEIISNTTRKPRDYEKDGIDYHFISLEEFTKKMLNGEMVEATQFNNWFYGTSIDSLDKDKINVGVFNPEGINCLWDNKDIQVIPIYIDAKDKIRLLRQLKREKYPDCEEICRRFFADEKDFQPSKYDFDFFTFQNNEEEINIEELKTLINYDDYCIGGGLINPS